MLMMMLVVVWSALTMPTHSGGSIAQTTQYSNMQYVAESGDVLGYDLRIVSVDGGRRVTMFCADGGLTGPVHAEIPPGSASVTIAKSEDGCGAMKLKILKRAIRIEFEDGSITVVPLHKNYMQAKEWK